MKKKIIIDTDPAMGTKGGDPEDCFAIMLAMNSPELEILGITTVQGNVPVERGFSNASYLVKQLGKDIQINNKEKLKTKENLKLVNDLIRKQVSLFMILQLEETLYLKNI